MSQPSPLPPQGLSSPHDILQRFNRLQCCTLLCTLAVYED